jgi:hypothetical protein
MRWRDFMLLGAGLVLAASGSPSASGSGSDAGLTIETPSLFSYVAPSGWTSQVGPSGAMGGFPQAVGPASNNFTPDITFKTDGYESVASFVKAYRPNLVDVNQPFPMKLVDAKPFVTASGAKGYRLHSIDTANPPTAEQFSYVFPNPDGMVFEFACACAPADAAHYAPIFDASMKTVRILKLGEN